MSPPGPRRRPRCTIEAWKELLEVVQSLDLSVHVPTGPQIN